MSFPSHFSLLVMTPNEALVLHLDILPLGLGSISYYLPVLVNEESLVTSNAYESRQQQLNPKKASQTTKPTEMMVNHSQGGLCGVEYDSYNIEDIKRRVNNQVGLSNEGRGHPEEENDGDENEEEDEQEQPLPSITTRYLEEKDEDETCLEPHHYHYPKSSSNTRPSSFDKALKSVTSAPAPLTKPASRKSLFLLSSPEDD
jgi:hypothetical protein